MFALHSEPVLPRGAFLTERMPTLTLTVPVAGLLLVLLFVARPLEAAEQR